MNTGNDSRRFFFLTAGIYNYFFFEFLNFLLNKYFFLFFRHVVLPKELSRLVPKTHLMTENEWRAIGVQQSRGWIHYMQHTPEPHILLFRRPKSV